MKSQEKVNAMLKFDLQVATVKATEICRMVAQGKDEHYAKAIVKRIVDEQFLEIELELKELLSV